MPWSPRDANRFTHNADTPKLRSLWAKTANAALKAGDDESVAIRKANAAVRNAKKG